jgi:thiamine biosynthesis lipoprotein
VTVQAMACVLAGSATTIAMLKGREAGLAWLDELGVAYLAVAEDGTVIHRF